MLSLSRINCHRLSISAGYPVSVPASIETVSPNRASPYACDGAWGLRSPCSGEWTFETGRKGCQGEPFMHEGVCVPAAGKRHACLRSERWLACSCCRGKTQIRRQLFPDPRRSTSCRSKRVNFLHFEHLTCWMQRQTDAVCLRPLKPTQVEARMRRTEMMPSPCGATFDELSDRVQSGTVGSL